MPASLRYLLLFEAATFGLAALVHGGVLVSGYEHPQARIAETVIGTVLLAGAVASWLRPEWTRPAALGAQGFALLGTLVGIFTIIVGVGPRTVPDVIYHILIVIVLGLGLRAAMRMGASTAAPRV